MKPIQGSDSMSRTAVADQSTELSGPSPEIKSDRKSVPVSSPAEKKSASQIAEQNKATKNLEATVRQQELHDHVAPGGIFLAPGKPPKTSDISKVQSSADKGKLIYAEDGIAIFKNGKNHTVFGENKDLIPGKPKDGVNGVYVEDSNGNPHVFVFDKQGRDTYGHFEPKHYTPQQIVKMWEEERTKNPNASSDEIKQAVLKRRDEKYEQEGILKPAKKE